MNFLKHTFKFLCGLINADFPSGLYEPLGSRPLFFSRSIFTLIAASFGLLIHDGPPSPANTRGMRPCSMAPNSSLRTGRVERKGAGEGVSRESLSNASTAARDRTSTNQQNSLLFCPKWPEISGFAAATRMIQSRAVWYRFGKAKGVQSCTPL
jgi:hypothetical protein